jgi:hypothetical protein
MSTAMTRRGFLTGTLVAAGAVAGTALLKATPEEIQAFGKPLLGPVTVMQPTPVKMGEVIQPLGEAGEFVYNHKGAIIGVISEMVVERRPYDATPYGSEYRVYQSGLLEVHYKVVGTGFATVKAWTGKGFHEDRT